MFARINIMLCFLLFFAFDWTTAQDNFNIFTPEFIQSNSNFEISIITSKKFSDADKLDIFILTDISLIINKVELLTQDQKFQLSYHNEFIEDYSSQFKKISIDLADTTHFSNGSFFQIIISLKSTQATPNSLKFFGEFLNEEKTIGYFVNSKLKTEQGTDHLYELSFDYYQKFSVAGNALSLSQNSYLNIPLTYSFDKLLAVEFWMKIENPVSKFIEVINRETNRVEYYSSINDNQVLIFNSINDELLRVKPFFISRNVWYHFKINFNKEKSELSFSCDGVELTHFKINSNMDFENLVLHFQNEKTNGEFYLDQVRIINAEQESSAIDRNKNYSEYSDEHSEVLLQLNFNEEELNSLLANKVISFEKINLVNSDAPIFPRSPEINVKISDNFYEVIWGGGNYKDAAEYILERSTGNDGFAEVSKVTADSDENKKYSLLTEKIEGSEIVFFRIKQVNKDGSIIYSDVAKVGQGIVEDLIIGQNYPNPFNPTTVIEFELIQDSDVDVKVYDLTGKEIALLYKGLLNKGVHKYTFDGSEFPSGVYLYQITTPLSSQTRKMILAK